MCVFCEIAKGNIPSAKVYEDEDVLAILDLSQVTKGHTLVMPKQHFDTVLDCPEHILAKMAVTAQMIAKRQMERLGASGFNLLNNGFEVAGQSVMHAHIHVIPRYGKQDAVEFTFHPSEKQDLEAVAAELR